MLAASRCLVTFLIRPLDTTNGSAIINARSYSSEARQDNAFSPKCTSVYGAKLCIGVPFVEWRYGIVTLIISYIRTKVKNVKRKEQLFLRIFDVFTLQNEKRHKISCFN